MGLTQPYKPACKVRVAPNYIHYFSLITSWHGISNTPLSCRALDILKVNFARLDICRWSDNGWHHRSNKQSLGRLWYHITSDIHMPFSSLILTSYKAILSKGKTNNNDSFFPHSSHKLKFCLDKLFNKNT